MIPTRPPCQRCGCGPLRLHYRPCDGHTDDDVRNWFAEVVLPQHEAWVAVADDVIVGLLALADAELEQLYLEPTWRGRGLGDRFMRLAKQRRPNGLGLWTFQVNHPARRFYERHGFVEVDRTDGMRNEEREPDIRYVWRPCWDKDQPSLGQPPSPSTTPPTPRG
ncbi:GNAT family N-acetyltransferase [Nocardia terpenica]|nr:GNAT family N-acetyltransferase [Nocardia terpenica]